MPSSWPSTAPDLFRRAAGRALDLVCPPRCFVCDRLLTPNATATACPSCRERLVVLSSPLCPRCGQPRTERATGDALCLRCRNERRFFRRARSVLRYDETSARLVAAFKFHDRVRLRRLFGPLLREHYPFSETRFDRIVPVPLHVARLCARGYNQSLVLAREVAAFLDVPVDTDAIARARDTRPQVGLRGHDRRENVQGAFRAGPGSGLRGAEVLLVDDVFTTGSTAAECARVLRGAGVRAVDVLTLARAVPAERAVDHCGVPRREGEGDRACLATET